MSLQEELEKAFEAGAEYIIDNTNSDFDKEFVDYPSGSEIEIACTEYINGNLKSSQSNDVLHKSHGGSI